MKDIVEKPFAVITGASTGIGYELAKQFAENGFDILITAENAEIITAQQEFQQLGAHVYSVQADLTTYEGVEQLYQAIEATRRPVDAIAINAGVGASGEFATDTTLKEELNVISLNVVSSVHLAKRVASDMVKRGKGRILFTSSIAAIMPGPFFAVYAASKAFIQSFAIAIRSELKDKGITVTALLPGPTDTDFFERADMENTPVAQGPKDDPAEVARDGFKALMEGEDQIVAGAFKNKVQAVISKVMPETAKAALHRRQTEPETVE